MSRRSLKATHSAARFDFRLGAVSCLGSLYEMKSNVTCLLAIALLFSSCNERKEVTVTETRTATTRDASPKLFATNDERFQPSPMKSEALPVTESPPAGPIKGETPPGWTQLASSQFRLLNYRFGESGEVWVSLSGGAILDNVNRWRRQFKGDPLNPDDLSKLQPMTIAGASGVFVTAEGLYEPGMGNPEKPGFALAGVVASLSDGRILTVKMVGPKAEVTAAQPVLETYIKSLKLAE